MEKLVEGNGGRKRALARSFGKMGLFIAPLFCSSRTLREHQNSQAALAEKLVSGKLTKQQFLDQEALVVKRKEECKEKIVAITTHLQSV